jgi:hypothetical protein
MRTRSRSRCRGRLPARSVTPTAGVQLTLAAAAAMVGTPLGVPRVMVRLEPALPLVASDVVGEDRRITHGLILSSFGLFLY